MGSEWDEEVEELKKRNPDTRETIRAAIRDKMHERVYDVEEVKEKIKEHYGRDIFSEVHKNIFGKSHKSR